MVESRRSGGPMSRQERVVLWPDHSNANKALLMVKLYSQITGMVHVGVFTM